MSWNVFSGKVTGVRIEGDTNASPTRWWNHIYLALWGWKKCAALKLKDPALAETGYRVGYISFSGEAHICSKIQTSYGVRMKVGHENVTFFAVDRNNTEIPLLLHAVAPIDDKDYEAFALI